MWTATLLLAVAAVTAAYPLLGRRALAAPDGWPLTLWLAGELVVWVLAYLSLRFFFGVELAERPELRLGLYLGYAGGGLLTFLVVKDLFGSPARPTARELEPPATALALLAVAWVAGWWATGGLAARSLWGHVTPTGSAFYWVRAAEALPYPFAVAVGVLVGRTSRIRQLSLLGLGVLICMILVSSGGRGTAVTLLLAAVLGSFLPRNGGARSTVVFRAGALAVAVAALAVVGVARLNPAFAGAGSVRERLEVVGKSLERIEPGYAEAALMRIAEPQGQVVIEAARTRPPAYFEHFERLRFLYVPAVLAGDAKKPIDDGPDVLREEYGFGSIDRFKALPILTIPDLYRRFGAVGVFLGGMAVVGMLWFWPRVLGRVVEDEFVYAFGLVYLAVIAVRLAPFSVLGVIQQLFYTFPRDLIVCWGAVALARCLSPGGAGGLTRADIGSSGHE